MKMEYLKVNKKVLNVKEEDLKEIPAFALQYIKM
jgi:hypothetical protein